MFIFKNQTAGSFFLAASVNSLFKYSQLLSNSYSRDMFMFMSLSFPGKSEISGSSKELVFPTPYCDARTWKPELFLCTTPT